MNIKNMSFDILFKILSYLEQEELIKIKGVCKCFYAISTYIIRSKNLKLLKNNMFKKDITLLTWLNNKNYRIGYTLQTCINQRKLTKEYIDLKIFYFGEYYVNSISKNLQTIRKTLNFIHENI